jgi:hypothetical protein
MGINARGLLAVVAIVALISAGPVLGAPKPVTQGEFATSLVEALGWDGGLPEEHGLADYLAILGGNRTYRFEAEDIYDRASDSVTVIKYDLFGPFSGKGWLHGISKPTPVHFKVFIPLAGRYTLKAASKGDGQVWSVGPRAFKVNAGGGLHEVTVGTVDLPAGPLEFNVVVPADGAVDYLLFSAPALAPVAPVGGWHPADPLRIKDLAQTSAVLLNLEQKLPADTAGQMTIPVATAVKLPPTVTTTTADFYGKPLSGTWVRVLERPAVVPVPVEARAPGVYGFRVRCLGAEVTAGFGQQLVTRPARPYLDWVDLGSFRLEAGVHPFLVELPPSAGVDAVEVVPRRSNVADYLAVTGLAGAPNDPVTDDRLFDILVSLVDRYQNRP